MSHITIYHNPDCGTSRNALALILNAGVEPRVIHYLQTPPSRDEFVALVSAMGIAVRDVLRQKGTPFDELKLGDSQWSDDELIDFVMQYPILMNRPIVVTPLGTRLCRPSELVLDLLSSPQRGEFFKEDGQAVIDRRGEKVNGSSQ
jgi:arsenate reductase (glutaredoxin)